MGKLIIDGNSFFEIDEECIKKKKISKKCGLNKYLDNQGILDNLSKSYIQKKDVLNRTKRGDG